MDVFEPDEFPIGSDEWHRGPLTSLVAQAGACPEFGLDGLDASLKKYAADFHEHLFGEGQPEALPLGPARASLMFLMLKKIYVPRSIRCQVLACEDAHRLDEWVAQAVETGDVAWRFDE